MPNDSAFPKSLLAAALSAAFPFQAQAQTAARIDFAAGNVTASTADGRTRNLAKGAEVQVGETVNTQQGRAQMRFTDGAFVSLQPETQFKIENYVFEGRSTPNESAVMNLIKGGFRTISGLIGKTNRDGYKLQTATATVGIRGTEFSVAYDAGGSVSMFVAGGAIAVTNQSGTTVVPGGRSATVNSQNSAPQTTNEKPFLPPENLDNTKVDPPKQPFAPPPPPMLTGQVLEPGFAYVYTEPPANFATPRWDSTTSAAVLNAAGALTSFTNTQYVYDGEGYVQTLVTTTNGSSQTSTAGNDGVIAWGRWIGGADSNGKDLSVGGSGYGPFHWIVGLPVPAMPTSGTASYDIMGATASCAGFCTSAPVVTGSKLDVNFGTNSGQLSTNMNINGNANTFAGSASLSGKGFYASSSSNGYYFEGQGFFAGANAARAGMAYTVVSSSNGYSNPTALSISGVVAYKQTSSSGLGTAPRNP